MRKDGETVAKVLVVGDVATGKTSFIQRFCRGVFSAMYQTTIGVDFALKKLEIGSETIRMQLWDIAGQERFTGLSRIYYKDACAAFIVYDVTSAQTFNNVSKWKEDISGKVFLPNGSPLPVFLLGNKCDMEAKRQVRFEQGEALKKSLDFDGFFETSAKDNTNITEACISLTHIIIANNKKMKAFFESQQRRAVAAPSNHLVLTDRGNEANGEKSTCC